MPAPTPTLPPALAMPATPAAACWPLNRWPAPDQAAWELGCTPGDPFDDDPRHGVRLRPGSLQKLRKGYGRWLDFLDARGWLDPAIAPLARVTVPRLRAYFRALLTAGNADHTVIGRFAELSMALRVLAPGQDVSWVRRPDGVSVYALLHKGRRPMPAPDAAVLFRWGLEMMDRAAGRGRDSERRAAYRDGLLIAVLAARARRLRSMALIRVGHELVRRGGRFHVELTPAQVKTHRADRFDLPEELTPYMDHYLAAVRPALLDGSAAEELWITTQGGPLGEAGIQGRILRLTKKRFGYGFGPHRFRHALATTAALRLPEHALLGAGLLNITPGVYENSYNLAPAAEAADRYAALIERRRRQARG